MKAIKQTDTQLAFQAMNRAAGKVLGKAVAENRPLPIWDGEKVVWKVPREEARQVAEAESHRASAKL